MTDKPATRKRHFSIGDFDIVVTGPADSDLKFEHRHNYVQLATGDGELREINGGSPSIETVADALQRLVPADRRGSQTSSIPSEGAGTDHVLSAVGLAASTPGAENLDGQQLTEVGMHLKAVADSVGGF